MKTLNPKVGFRLLADLPETKSNKSAPAQAGAPLKFPKYAKNTIVKLLPIFQCRKKPQEIRIKLGNQNWKHKKSIVEKYFQVLGKRRTEPKNG